MTADEAGRRQPRSRLYTLPEVYDFAFSWDLSEEIAFFKRVFGTHVPFEVRHILEPACGTGRFLRTLPAHGFHVTDYDINPTMLRHTRDSLVAAGYAASVRIVLANIVSAEIHGEFDAAFNSINSIGHLQRDDDIVAHLYAAGSSLREDGVYIVHLNFAHEEALPTGDRWAMERGGIRVKTWWRILSEDRDTRLRHQIGTFEVEGDDRIERFDDRHLLRLWLISDLRDLLHRSGRFENSAIYGESAHHWD